MQERYPSLPHFKENLENFLADIEAEVVMNKVPPELIFNWDQTALHLVSTGQWTMHRAREKVITISNSDDKHQVTAVFVATLTGDFLAPQIIHKGNTERSHPKFSVPSGWDIWHSDNHWSNEETMKQYIEKIIVPYLDAKRVLYSSACHTQLLQFLIACVDKPPPNSYLCSKAQYRLYASSNQLH